MYDLMLALKKGRETSYVIVYDPNDDTKLYDATYSNTGVRDKAV